MIQRAQYTSFISSPSLLMLAKPKTSNLHPYMHYFLQCNLLACFSTLDEMDHGEGSAAQLLDILVIGQCAFDLFGVEFDLKHICYYYLCRS